MTERIYPAAKPAVNGTATISATNPSFPATKAQLYGASRPAYRPQPHRHRYRRSCCCSCCLWTTLSLLILLLLAAIAGTVFFFLYRPHRPTFAVSSLKISFVNVTSSSKLNSRIDLNITARNPNKKLVYIYDPATITVSANDVSLGQGTLPAFVHGTKNTTLLKSAITSSGQDLDSTAAGALKSDAKSKNGLPLKIRLDTKVKVKIGGLKSPKIGIRVSCDGIRAGVPTGKTATTASISNAKCKVDVRVKIWKWTF